MKLFTFPEQKLFFCFEFGCTAKCYAGCEDWVRSVTGVGQLAGAVLQCGAPPGGGGGELETGERGRGRPLDTTCRGWSLQPRSSRLSWKVQPAQQVAASNINVKGNRRTGYCYMIICHSLNSESIFGKMIELSCKIFPGRG